jgi:hypothetical protein
VLKTLRFSSIAVNHYGTRTQAIASLASLVLPGEDQLMKLKLDSKTVAGSRSARDGTKILRGTANLTASGCGCSPRRAAPLNLGSGAARP